VTEVLFDLSEEYEAMLNQGIRLSGESMQFFLDGRLNLLQSRLKDSSRVSRILDFGCGLGYTSARLRSMFPAAEITGVDTSCRALETARARNGAPGIRFLPAQELNGASGEYDLCYVNGVFHHIPHLRHVDARRCEGLDGRRRSTGSTAPRASSRLRR